MKAVSIENLSVSLNGKEVLKKINLSLEEKKFIGIVGPNGGGKTTLLRLLNKLDSPSEGIIYLNNKDISTIPPRTLRKEIGMVFQLPALFSGTIEENIQFGPKLLKKEINIKDIKYLLKIVGLEHIELNREVEKLSIGQQQRL